VPRDLHAVERNRRLVAGVFGLRIDSPARYGIVAAGGRPAWAPAEPYAVFLHAASRPQKRWAEDRWIALGTLLAGRGLRAVLPSGTPAEREAAERMARSIPGAIAAPAMGLAEAADLLAQAWLVVGVDTGLTHLGVALRRPTVGLYGATRPDLTGLHGENSVNLGAPGVPPTVEEVADAIGPLEDGFSDPA
jgi:heptosyltransferase-1